MFKNYIKTAWRNINRNKVFSLINILGLAIGMGCAIMSSLFVLDELSYENFHQNADRIYRIVMKNYIGSAAAFAPALKGTIPEIEEIVRIDNFSRWSKLLLSYGDKRFYEERFLLVEPSFFKIFTFPFIKGSPETALIHPDSIVLTETTAQKYFGEDDPMGKTIILDNQQSFTVTGILKDVPHNSHLKFDLMAPFALNEREDRYGKRLSQNWSQANFITYFLLAKGASPAGLEEKVNQVYKDSGAYQNYKNQFFLQSLQDIHLKSNLGAELETNSSTAVVLFYSFIGLFVLIIACINSMNLATARSVRRAKEVGMRKVVGAKRSQLVRQFFGESLIMAFVALFFAVLLVEFTMPIFNLWTGKHLALTSSPLSVLVILICTAVITGVGSGIYPAMFLSAFNPLTAFRSSSSLVNRGAFLRKLLVIVQFSLSIIFIICTLVVWNQIKFIKNQNLGLNKDHVVMIPLFKESREKYEFIKNDIMKHPGIISTSASNFLPSGDLYHHGLWWEGKAEAEQKSMFWMAVDHDFIKTFELELLEGRNFSRQLSTDTKTAYIFNEAAMKEFGKDFIQGRKFSIFGEKESAPVIGIVKDFHFKSLHSKLEPLILCIVPSTYNNIAVKTHNQDIPAVLSHLRRVWQDHVPQRPFEYFFLDENFDKLYKTEERTGKLFSFFTFLAIFVSCLGLFALASFMTEQRTKDIGVRKVFGASVLSITFLLSKEYSKWVLLANIFAWPVAYYAMNQWLQNFAYRTTIGIEVFALSGLLVLVIALLTVSYQSINAASGNPVEALRYE